MKRLERLTALLSLLQSRRHTPIGSIVERFQVSERTIYRDIKALDEAGVPISFEEGKGYFILDGHFIPPLSFTLEEAKSFIFVEQLARKYTDPPTFNHFSSALEKIKNKLKDHQLEGMEQLESSVRAYIDDDYTPQYLSVIEQACSEQRVIRIQYKDLRGITTERTIEPIGITFYSQTWHVIAFCRLRNDYRDFVLLRIESLHLTPDVITEPRLTLSEYVQKLQAEENH